MDTSAFEFLYGNEAKLPAYKKEMLQACRTGDLSRLQRIYQAHNIQPGAQLDWMENDDKPPTAFKLFITAIIHEHVPIVQYLLFMHPESELDYEMVVLAIVDHPNLEIMELVHKHQPNIINLQYRHTHTFLTDACQGGGTYDSPPSNKTLPLIHYLLDNGADPQKGSWRDCGALCTALEFSRPLEILDKMIDKGATVDDFVFSEAVRSRRIDAVELFFEKATLHCSTKKMLHEARKTKDREIKSLVKAGVAKRTDQPKWWQIWK